MVSNQVENYFEWTIPLIMELWKKENGKEILKGQGAKSFKVGLKTKTGHNFDNRVE